MIIAENVASVKFIDYRLCRSDELSTTANIDQRLKSTNAHTIHEHRTPRAAGQRRTEQNIGNIRSSSDRYLSVLFYDAARRLMFAREHWKHSTVIGRVQLRAQPTDRRSRLSKHYNVWEDNAVASGCLPIIPKIRFGARAPSQFQTHSPPIARNL
uniref:Uncharacterized protein n=1 Tax=Plectus sambesii TaxID=2011161 RepID=A0A914WJN6_9BILA